MPTENRNPQNAKPVGGRQPENPERQAGQATGGAGNPAGQKAAQQQGGAGGTSDQGGKLLRAGLDQPGGPMPQDAGWEHESRKLRQGTPETEETED